MNSEKFKALCHNSGFRLVVALIVLSIIIATCNSDTRKQRRVPTTSTTRMDSNELYMQLRAQALQGNQDAIYRVGRMLLLGEGVTQDRAKGLELLNSIANKDHARAQMLLGYAYVKGRGVERNDNLAFYWLDKSSNLGDRDAQSALAIMYRDGLGTEVDLVQAYVWAYRAAAKGDEKSQKTIKDLETRMTDTEKSQATQIIEHNMR